MLTCVPILTGFLLEDLATAHEYLAQLGEADLQRIAISSLHPEVAGAEVLTLVAGTWTYLSAVALARGPLAGRGEPNFLLDARASRLDTERQLRDEGWPEDTAYADFREVFDWLLGLDDDVLSVDHAGPTPEQDRGEVNERLEQIVRQLDRLERIVNHCGNWPR